MRELPAEIASDIVVEAHGVIACISEFITDAEGKIVAGANLKAGVILVAGHIREQAHTQCILAVRRGIGEAGVVVIEYDALVGELIQGRRQFFGNQDGGVGLSADLNQIIALEHSGRGLSVF